MKNRSVFIVNLMLAAYFASFGQPGTLDGDFDADGIVITNITDFGDIATSVKVQPDGKIVVSGYSGSLAGAGDVLNFSTVRYNIDGTLDNSFGIGGIITTDFGNNDNAHSNAIQPDGKIIVAGYAEESQSDVFQFALVRYTVNGLPDNSFGIDGKVRGPFGKGHSVALQSDGKILVAGHDNSNERKFLVARYNADGTPDNSFGTDGSVTASMGISDVAQSVAIQPDGKIVVAGWSDNGSDLDFALVRFNPDGSHDNSFSVDGKVTTAVGSEDDRALSVVIMEDGKILLAGYTVPAFEFALVRYNPDGTLDTDFDFDGKVTGPGGVSVDMVLQPDGKIIVAGGDVFFQLARYNVDGTLDDSFGEDGVVITTSNNINGANCAAIQPDGRIVLAGYADFENWFGFAVARYLSGLSFGVVDFSIKNNSVLIYPNPVIKEAVLEYTLTNEETINIDLYDISGELVQSFVKSEKRAKGNHKELLDIDTSIPPGSYILTLSNGVGNLSIKVIK